ncbi:MAG: SlyX family protein [Candidatus Ornithospirochaeta sp.]|nr:SlyX family protein [Candidatus Ornithospirochaeta sp.]
MNEEIERLEIKISYLESQNAELNEVVIEQGRSIDSLLARIDKLEKKVMELIEEAGDGERPNRRPPHY